MNWLLIPAAAAGIVLVQLGAQSVWVMVLSAALKVTLALLVGAVLVLAWQTYRHSDRTEH